MDVNQISDEQLISEIEKLPMCRATWSAGEIQDDLRRRLNRLSKLEAVLVAADDYIKSDNSYTEDSWQSLIEAIAEAKR